MKTLALIALTLLIGGCATPQLIKLDPPAAPVTVEASGVTIVDLTKQDDELRQRWVTTGFSRIPDSVFAEPLGESLRRDLTSQLIPSGKGQAVDVWIVDAGFHFEKTAADFVPILNIFTYMQSGRLKCDATVTVRRGGQSRKTTIEHFVAKIDTSNLQTGEMIWKNAARECYPGLLSKVMAAIGAP